MESRLLALKLAFAELGIEANADEFETRLVMQKAVCLAKVCGVDLGYRFTWYAHGPYSKDLTRDYYQLSAQPLGDEHNKSLRDPVIVKLHHIRAACDELPNHIDRPRWMELLASIAFLNRSLGYDEQKCLQTISDLKGTLVPFFHFGWQSWENLKQATA